METNMFLTTKLNLMSGIVIGAAAVTVMKQMCNRKHCKKNHETHTPVATTETPAATSE